jgi:hypothetical protein
VPGVFSRSEKVSSFSDRRKCNQRLARRAEAQRKPGFPIDYSSKVIILVDKYGGKMKPFAVKYRWNHYLGVRYVSVGD